MEWRGMCALTAASAAFAFPWWTARQAGESVAAAVCSCLCCAPRLETSASARRMGVCGAGIEGEGATECIESGGRVKVEWWASGVQSAAGCCSGTERLL